MMNRSYAKTVGVVGIGRMGRCIVNSLPKCKKIFIIDKILTPEMEKLAIEKDAILTTDFTVLEEAEIIILALPPEESIAFAERINDICSHACLINISTLINKESFKAICDNMKPYFIKIIGEASEISQGNKPIIIIQKEDCSAEETELFSSLFSNFGELIFSENEFYCEVNSIASIEIIEAILKVEKKLIDCNMPRKIINKAIKNVMKGTCNTYPWDENDDFINKVKKSCLY